MTLASDRTVSGAAATTRAATPTSYPDDQLYLLKLCLELQLEALLLALGSSAVTARSARGERAGVPRGSHAGHPADLPWEKWLLQDLELTCALTRDCVEDGVPLPSSMGLVGEFASGGVVDALAARYSAMAAVVSEMLDRTDPHLHSSAVQRLVDTRTRCEERLDALLGESPEVAARRLFDYSELGPEPGHYLG